MTSKQKRERWREFREALRDYRHKRRAAALAAVMGDLHHGYGREITSRAAIEVCECADKLFGVGL